VLLGSILLSAGGAFPVEEAKERLANLEAHGPTAYAFTFQRGFGAPGVEKNLDAAR